MITCEVGRAVGEATAQLWKTMKGAGGGGLGGLASARTSSSSLGSSGWKPRLPASNSVLRRLLVTRMVAKPFWSRCLRWTQRRAKHPCFLTPAAECNIETSVIVTAEASLVC